MIDAGDLAALATRIADAGPTLVAFSGGVDSSLVLAVARDVLGDRCHAITAVSETMAQAEVEDARAFGAELGLGTRHHLVPTHELAREGFVANAVDRCAHCKAELLDVAAPLAARLGLETIALGVNVDDLAEPRPGVAAARGRGARFPLVEAGFTKAQVRAAARALGLRTWDKPQLACLSSRFPFGTPITAARLRQVDELEAAVRALGFRDVRVRFHDTVARLELGAEQLEAALAPRTRAAIVAHGRACGFTYVALDLQGFRSGSAHEALVPLGRRP